jgi:hypothetical protein
MGLFQQPGMAPVDQTLLKKARGRAWDEVRTTNTVDEKRTHERRGEARLIPVGKISRAS